MANENLIFDGTNILMMAVSSNTMDYNFRHEYIGGVTGTLKTIGNIISMINPSHTYIAFDLCKSRHRLAIHPEYKAGRDDQFKDLEFKLRDAETGGDKETIRKVKDKIDLRDRHKHKKLHTIQLLRILPLLGVQCVINLEHEADDIIANFVKQSKRNCTIVSTDKDFFQLVNDRTRVYRPVNGEFVTRINVETKLGYQRDWIVPVKILNGDVSDNIKGVEGIGDATAVKIFNEAGGTDLELLYKWCSAKMVKKSVKAENLIKFLDDGIWERNQQLMDLNLTPEIDILKCLRPIIKNPDELMYLISEIGLDEALDDQELGSLLAPFSS